MNPFDEWEDLLSGEIQMLSAPNSGEKKSFTPRIIP